ncbi:MAG: YkgJ family cysteine cluster protein [Burkholderiales bacterium]
MKPNNSEIRQLLLYTKDQVKKAHAELDARMTTITNACSKGCDACCHQMVAVHTWEESLIGAYINTEMHDKTKKIVRRQMMDWWRELRVYLRPATRENPITFYEYQALQQGMIYRRVMCPFLVDKACSIYPVRPAICRSYVVPNDPQRCFAEPGRIGDAQALPHMAELFGPNSALLPVERYFHGMKPITFAMTGVFNLPVASTPVQSFMIGDLLPIR